MAAGISFLTNHNTILLLVTWFYQLLIDALATYMRVFKEEPLLVYWLVFGICIQITMPLIANFGSTHYLLHGSDNALLFGFPWIYIIFKKKRDIVYNANFEGMLAIACCERRHPSLERTILSK